MRLKSYHPIDSFCCRVVQKTPTCCDQKSMLIRCAVEVALQMLFLVHPTIVIHSLPSTVDLQIRFEVARRFVRCQLVV